MGRADPVPSSSVNTPKDRPDWHDRAACRGLTSMFFPDVGENGLTKKVRLARQICQTCTVRQQCLDYSLTLPHPWHGIYAGFTPKQRQRMKGNNNA